MKNKFLLLIATIFSLLVIPSNVFAETKVSGLKDAVNEEIELFGSAEGYEEAVEELKKIDLSSYEESDDKVNIYLFRGSTCSHCFDAISYFASVADEYGKYFNIKSYEVWSNEDNADLMTKVGEKLGDDVSGVPYIVVGKKSWSGFTDSYGEEIIEEVKAQYDKEESERYDIIKEVSGDDSSSSSSDVITLIIILLVTGGIVTGIIMARKNAS